MQRLCLDKSVVDECGRPTSDTIARIANIDIRQLKPVNGRLRPTQAILGEIKALRRCRGSTVNTGLIETMWRYIPVTIRRWRCVSLGFDPVMMRLWVEHADFLERYGGWGTSGDQVPRSGRGGRSKVSNPVSDELPDPRDAQPPDASKASWVPRTCAEPLILRSRATTLPTSLVKLLR